MGRNFYLLALATLINAPAFAQNSENVIIGTNFSGQIDNSSPILEFSGGHYKIANIAIPKGKILIVTATSKDFSPFIEIGNIKAGENCYNCAIGGDTKNGQILAKILAPNDINQQIRISSGMSDKNGAFTLATKLLDYVEPPPKMINAPAKIAGKLDYSDKDDGDALFQDIYNLNLRKGQALEFDVKSTAFDPVIEITPPKGAMVRDDDGGAGKNAHLTYRALIDGQYVLAVRSSDYKLGEYSLNISPQKAAFPRALKPIATGQKIEDAISKNDFDLESGDKVFAKSYSFSALKNHSYWVSVNSKDFDPRVEIGRATQKGFDVRADDDDSGKDDGALLLFRAISNENLIMRVRPANENGDKTKLGSFNISVREAKIAPTPKEFGTLSGQNNGILSDGGPRDVNELLYGLYHLPLKAGDKILLRVAADFDSQLEIGILNSGKFESMVKDDDSAGGQNPQVFFQAQNTQDYIVKIKASESFTGGNYSIIATPIAPAAIAIETPINLDTEATGNLNQNSPSFGANALAYNLYNFQAKAGETYIFNLNSKDFDPIIGIKSKDGNQDFKSNDDSKANPPNSQFEYAAIKDETLIIRAASFKNGGYGNYVLKVTKKPLQ